MHRFCLEASGYEVYVGIVVFVVEVLFFFWFVCSWFRELSCGMVMFVVWSCYLCFGLWFFVGLLWLFALVFGGIC